MCTLAQPAQVYNDFGTPARVVAQVRHGGRLPALAGLQDAEADMQLISRRLHTLDTTDGNVTAIAQDFAAYLTACRQFGKSVVFNVAHRKRNMEAALNGMMGPEKYNARLSCHLKTLRDRFNVEQPMPTV